MMPNRRFGPALVLLILVAVTDIRIWFRFAYPFYIVCLLLLAAVELKGSIGMWAQRWIDIGFMQLQPSEVMKVALVLALARYFHGIPYRDLRRPLLLLPPLAMAAAPALLVMRQPDLGTGGMLQITKEMGQMPAQWLPYFMVNDTDKTVARVKELGGKAWCEPMDIPTIGRIAFFSDTQGAGFAVIKPLPMDKK